MNIVILLSAGRDPRSGLPRPVGAELQAIALAHTLPHATLTGLHAGVPDSAVTDTFGHGLTAITVLGIDPADDPMPSLAAELAATRPTLVLAGRRGCGGSESGLLPYRLAHACGYAIAADALALDIADNIALVTQFLPRGARRSLSVPLPAIVTVHESAPPSLPFVYRNRRSGVLTERPGIASPRSAQAITTHPYRQRPKLITETIEAPAGRLLTNPTPDQAAAEILAYIDRFRKA